MLTKGTFELCLNNFAVVISQLDANSKENDLQSSRLTEIDIKSAFLAIESEPTH